MKSEKGATEDLLMEAVSRLHGCDCAHSGTIRVVEFYEGRKVFDGNVETFTLSGHPQASEAFETSSRRKISLFEYSEWIIRCRTSCTSAWKAWVSAC